MTTLDNANDINANTTEHKVVKNTLPFDITTNGIEFLAKSNAEYAGYIKSDRGIVDEMEPALKRASDDKQSYRGNNAVVQALFESGFLSTRDSDFNTDELFRSVYGIKCVSAITAYLELHQWLMDNDYTDHIGETEPATLYQHEDSVTCFECNKRFPTEDKDAGCPTCTTVINQKTWNSSGDNYYSAYQFPHELSDSEAILSEGSERIETLIELLFATLNVLLMVVIFHQLQKLG